MFCRDFGCRIPSAGPATRVRRPPTDCATGLRIVTQLGLHNSCIAQLEQRAHCTTTRLCSVHNAREACVIVGALRPQAADMRRPACSTTHVGCKALVRAPTTIVEASRRPISICRRCRRAADAFALSTARLRRRPGAGQARSALFTLCPFFWPGFRSQVTSRVHRACHGARTQRLPTWFTRCYFRIRRRSESDLWVLASQDPRHASVRRTDVAHPAVALRPSRATNSCTLCSRAVLLHNRTRGPRERRNLRPANSAWLSLHSQINEQLPQPLRPGRSHAHPHPNARQACWRRLAVGVCRAVRTRPFARGFVRRVCPTWQN